MSKSTRRSFLTGTLGVGAAIMLPTAAPIAGLAPIATLASLAAEGKYASVVHQLPADVNEPNFRFSLNGEELPEGTYLDEIYAPGGDDGWAVVIEHKGKGSIEDAPVRLVRGNWKMWREDVG